MHARQVGPRDKRFRCDDRSRAEGAEPVMQADVPPASTALQESPLPHWRRPMVLRRYRHLGRHIVGTHARTPRKGRLKRVQVFDISYLETNTSLDVSLHSSRLRSGLITNRFRPGPTAAGRNGCCCRGPEPFETAGGTDRPSPGLPNGSPRHGVSFSKSSRPMIPAAPFLGTLKRPNALPRGSNVGFPIWKSGECP